MSFVTRVFRQVSPAVSTGDVKEAAVQPDAAIRPPLGSAASLGKSSGCPKLAMEPIAV